MIPSLSRTDETDVRVGGTEGNWSENDQSRPHLCWIREFNFTIFNVFHYGFQAEDFDIITRSHFYPPASIEGLSLLSL